MYMKMKMKISDQIRGVFYLLFLIMGFVIYWVLVGFYIWFYVILYITILLSSNIFSSHYPLYHFHYHSYSPSPYHSYPYPYFLSYLCQHIHIYSSFSLNFDSYFLIFVYQNNFLQFSIVLFYHILYSIDIYCSFDTFFIVRAVC